MRKYEVLSSLINCGVVAVLRSSSPSSLYPTISAIKVGGIKAIEITCTVPKADEIVAKLRETDSELLVGAGTVLDAFTARILIMKGASFIVSPSFSKDVAKVCNLYDVLYIPGVATATEICTAMESGSSLLKLFPASSHSPTIIKDFLGPFPQCSFMPTGGISLNNAAEWIRCGASLLGVGSVLTTGAKNGNYELVKDTAKAFLKEVEKARTEEVIKLNSTKNQSGIV